MFCRCPGPRNVPRFNIRASNENVRSASSLTLIASIHTSRMSYLAPVSSDGTLHVFFWCATHTCLRNNVTFVLCRAMQPDGWSRFSGWSQYCVSDERAAFMLYRYLCMLEFIIDARWFVPYNIRTCDISIWQCLIIWLIR